MILSRTIYSTGHCASASTAKFVCKHCAEFLFKFVLRRKRVTRARLTGLARSPGPISPWVHMSNFSPVSEMRKERRRVVARNSRNKANTVKHKIITFTPIIIALATLIAVPLQLNGMRMMWKIQQAMQDDAEFIPLSSR